MNVMIGRESYHHINAELVIDKLSHSIMYGQEYLDVYEALGHSVMSMKLCQWRRAYAESWCDDGAENIILDFGCGYSPIIKQMTEGALGQWNSGLANWFGTDCNELVAEVPHMNGRWILVDEVNLKTFDVICFFDVIEHLRDYRSILKQVAVGSAIVITVPCWEDWDNINDIQSWLHFKPGEHFLYGSSKGWILEMLNRGFELIDHNTHETALGRLDSHTMAFKKVRNA